MPRTRGRKAGKSRKRDRGRRSTLRGRTKNRKGGFGHCWGDNGEYWTPATCKPGDTRVDFGINAW